MEVQSCRGPLVIIGGAEDRDGDCHILREFVRCAGGVKARIAVIPVAAKYPQETGKDYVNLFQRLGVADAQALQIDAREAADRADVLAVINRATGVFFTGGDQSRIIRLLQGTQLDLDIHQRYKQGMVVAGTSAGAAMMPDVMIVEGESGTNPRQNSVAMGPGMGFLPGVVIDQHFTQRGRLGRMLAALLLEPTVLGFGIDENTAMIVEGDEFRVVGAGSVTVIDESETTYNNLDRQLVDEPLTVFGVKLHILSQGYRFNLVTRQPSLPCYIPQSPQADSQCRLS